MRHTEPRLIQKAYKFALDPTPAQARAFASHAGGVRFAYNWGITEYAKALDLRAAEKEATGKAITPESDHFALCKMWTAYKDAHRDVPDDRGRTLEWVGGNFVGAYQAALRDAYGAWRKMWDSRNGRRRGRLVGRPRYKSRHKSRWSFQMHGDGLDLPTAEKIRPPVAPRKNRTLSRAARAKMLEAAKNAARVRRPDATGTDIHREARAAYTTALAATRKRGAAHLHGPQVSQSGTHYINLPKIGMVNIPGKLRIGDWVDRNTRTVRKLAHLLADARTAGLATCPGCGGSGEIHVVKAGELKKGVTDPAPVRCPSCRGAGKVERARIVRATISRGASGTWWCSVTAELLADIPVTSVDCPGCAGNGWRTNRDGDLVRCVDCEGRRIADEPVPSRRQHDNGAVGVDLGTMYLAVTSDTAGNAVRYDNSRLLDTALTDLRAASRALSRTRPDSKRREKARRRLGTLHEQVALMRHYATNKLTTDLVRSHARIGVEGWDAQRLAQHGSAELPVRRRRDRNRALADAAPGMIRNQLGLKSKTSGCRLVKTEADDPTGRTCSRCGWARTKPIAPAEYLFVCERCGQQVDRRVNTARVLRGRAEGSTARPALVAEPRGEDVRPDTPRKGRVRQSSVKRAARSRKRGKTGTSDP